MPGHWEGDLIEGRAGKSQIGTLVERTTRFTMLVPLPDGRSAAAFAAAVTPVIAGLPDGLRRSLTWDQGKEMGLHRQIAVAADCEIYFCDPHSPWQRPGNENTNGLLRQYFPKGSDLSAHGPQRLAEVADQLNGRPAQGTGLEDPGRGDDRPPGQPARLSQRGNTRKSTKEAAAGRRCPAGRDAAHGTGPPLRPQACSAPATRAACGRP